MTDATLDLREALDFIRRFNEEPVLYEKESATPGFNANPSGEKKQDASSTEGTQEASKSPSNAPQKDNPTKQPSTASETQQNAPSAQESHSAGDKPSIWFDGFEYKWDPDFKHMGKVGAYVCYRVINALGTVVPMVLLQDKENKPYAKIDYPERAAKEPSALQDEQNGRSTEIQQNQPQRNPDDANPDKPTPGIVKYIESLKVAGADSYSSVPGIYDPRESWVTWNQNPNEFAEAKNKWVANNLNEGFSDLAKRMARMRLEGRSTGEITDLMRTAATNLTEILRAAHGSEGGYKALSAYSGIIGSDLTQAKKAVDVRNAVTKRINQLGAMSAKDLYEFSKTAHEKYFAERRASRNPWTLEERAAANKEVGIGDIFVDLSETFDDDKYSTITESVLSGEPLADNPTLASIKSALEQSVASSNIRESNDKKDFLETEGTRDYFWRDLDRLYTLEQQENALIANASPEVKGTDVYNRQLDTIRFAKEAAKQKLAKSVGVAAAAWREKVGRVDDVESSLESSNLPEPVEQDSDLYKRAFLNRGSAWARVSDLQVDPARFQFKQGVDKETGAGETLRGVGRYDEGLGGRITVWHDPTDRRDYVVNGHHRFELAQRAERNGQKNIRLEVYFVNAQNAEEAKVIGALANLAENHASVIDATVFLRHHNAAVLQDNGTISKDNELIKKAMPLVSLSAPVFNRLEQAGKDAVPGATAIAETLKMPTTNTALSDAMRRVQEEERDKMETLQKRAWDFLSSKGKLGDYDYSKEVALEFLQAETKSAGQSLFGDALFDTDAEQRIEGRARIVGELKKRLGGVRLNRAGKSAAREFGGEEGLQKFKEAEERARKVLETYQNARANFSDKSGINETVRKATEEYAKAKDWRERQRIVSEASDAIERIVAGGGATMSVGSQTNEAPRSDQSIFDGTEEQTNADRPSTDGDDGDKPVVETEQKEPETKNGSRTLLDEEPTEEETAAALKALRQVEPAKEPPIVEPDKESETVDEKKQKDEEPPKSNPLFDVVEEEKEESKSDEKPSAFPSLFDNIPSEEETKTAKEALRKSEPQEEQKGQENHEKPIETETDKKKEPEKQKPELSEALESVRKAEPKSKPEEVTPEQEAASTPESNAEPETEDEDMSPEQKTAWKKYGSVLEQTLYDLERGGEYQQKDNDLLGTDFEIKKDGFIRDARRLLYESPTELWKLVKDTRLQKDYLNHTENGIARAYNKADAAKTIQDLNNARGMLIESLKESVGAIADALGIEKPKPSQETDRGKSRKQKTVEKKEEISKSKEPVQQQETPQPTQQTNASPNASLNKTRTTNNNGLPEIKDFKTNAEKENAELKRNNLYRLWKDERERDSWRALVNKKEPIQEDIATLALEKEKEGGNIPDNSPFFAGMIAMGHQNALRGTTYADVQKTVDEAVKSLLNNTDARFWLKERSFGLYDIVYEKVEELLKEQKNQAKQQAKAAPVATQEPTLEEALKTIKQQEPAQAQEPKETPLPSDDSQWEETIKAERKNKNKNRGSRSLKNRDEQEGDAADLWLKAMESKAKSEPKPDPTPQQQQEQAKEAKGTPVQETVEEKSERLQAEQREKYREITKGMSAYRPDPKAAREAEGWLKELAEEEERELRADIDEARSMNTPEDKAYLKKLRDEQREKNKQQKLQTKKETKENVDEQNRPIIDAGNLPSRVIDAIIERYGSVEEGIEELAKNKSFVKKYNQKATNLVGDKYTRDRGILGSREGYDAYLSVMSGERDFYEGDISETELKGKEKPTLNDIPEFKPVEAGDDRRLIPYSEKEREDMLQQEIMFASMKKLRENDSSQQKGLIEAIKKGKIEALAYNENILNGITERNATTADDGQTYEMGNILDEVDKDASIRKGLKEAIISAAANYDKNLKRQNEDYTEAVTQVLDLYALLFKKLKTAVHTRTHEVTVGSKNKPQKETRYNQYRRNNQKREDEMIKIIKKNPLLNKTEYSLESALSWLRLTC